MKKEEFIQKIAGYVKKYAAAYEIKVCSPIIAQAILESGWILKLTAMPRFDCWLYRLARRVKRLKAGRLKA